MVNRISNKGPCTLVLSSLILEPGFDLSLSHPQCKGKYLSVGWQQVVLILKPSLKNLDLVWSKPHSASSCMISPDLVCVISILFHRPITICFSTCIGDRSQNMYMYTGTTLKVYAIINAYGNTVTFMMFQ